MTNLRHSPLIRMFGGKTDNKEINRVQKRALSILLRDYDASFDELLVKMKRKLFMLRTCRCSRLKSINLSIITTLIFYGSYLQGNKLNTI